MKTKSVLLITFLLSCSIICFAQDTIRACHDARRHPAQRVARRGWWRDRSIRARLTCRNSKPYSAQGAFL